MARLKIGSGIQLVAQLPEGLNELTYIDALIEQKQPEIDMAAVLEKVKAMLPPITSTEVIVTKEVDLSHLATKSEMTDAIIKLCDQRDLNSAALDEMHERINLLEEQSERSIQLPEVKQITHIQDVSDTVRTECKERVKQTELNLMLKISQLQKNNIKQSRINKCLFCCILILIIVL